MYIKISKICTATKQTKLQYNNIQENNDNWSSQALRLSKSATIIQLKLEHSGSTNHKLEFTFHVNSTLARYFNRASRRSLLHSKINSCHDESQYDGYTLRRKTIHSTTKYDPMWILNRSLFRRFSTGLNSRNCYLVRTNISHLKPVD